jgi:hypothetical protein
MGSPRTDNLLVLIKFNVFRAMMSNGRDLGISGNDSLDDDALSPFNNPEHAINCNLPVPAALHPTKLQRQIPHHPWIDVLPFQRMRDNLLRAGDTYDDAQLCADLVGVFCASTDKHRTGMIIWGEPWDPTAWEVTESFVIYWGWTVRGWYVLSECSFHVLFEFMTFESKICFKEPIFAAKHSLKSY